MKARNDEDSIDPYRDHWSFGICLRSNRGAQGWQAGEAAKAVGADGLQAGRNSQGHQALGRRLCGTVRVCKIYEGTSEIQRLVISRQIKSEDKFNGLGEE